MANPYGHDLREKLLAAWDRREVMQEDLARAFGVSVSFLRALIRVRAQRASLEPEHLELLAKVIAQTPDATYEELTEQLHARGGPKVSRQTIGRAVGKLGLTRK